MLRLIALVLLSCLLTRVSCLITFVNPPPSGDNGDFSENPTYAVGSIVNIAWQGSEDGVGVSIVLYQLNQTDGRWFGNMEYLTQNSLGVTRYSWLVGTRKNTTLSNLFYLSAYQEGKGVSDSNSHYFNITVAKDAAVTTTSSTSPSAKPSTMDSALRTTSLSTTLPTSTHLSNTLINSAPTSVSGADPTSSSSANAPEGFPMAAKIGLGVAIPAALVLGIATGFMLFRRHRKKKDNTVELAANTYLSHKPHDQSKHHEAGYYTPKSHEAPLMSPVELGHLGDSYGTYNNHQHEVDKNKNNGQVLYEM